MANSSIIITPGTQSEIPDTFGFWDPVIGPSFSQYLDKLKNDGRTEEELKNIKKESLDILGKCIHPNERNKTSTGLVIGRIQSGKTSSFTAVSHLARDNGINIIVILSGTKKNLFSQTKIRLVNDLIGKQTRLWHAVSTDKIDKAKKDDLPSYFKDVKEKRRAIIFFSLKEKQHIKKLSEIISEGFKKDNYNVLVIDDESDQAGLNTFAAKNFKNGEVNKKKSPVYSSIINLRKLLPTHSYLLYTATPSANLLINTTDILSPNFAKFVTPGSNYTGGESYFPVYKKFIKILESHKDDGVTPKEYKEALSIYLIGYLDGCLKGENKENTKCRTMMVHTAREKEEHKTYKGFADEYFTEILSPYSKESSINKHLKPAYEALKITCENISNFDELIRYLYSDDFETPLITEINQTSSKSLVDDRGQFPWGDRYGRILIGGDLLNRGFTVEGLTITYMPRSAKQRTQDTIQQRCRFYGYRKDYLKYCRVFLKAETAQSIEQYIESEKKLREALSTFNKEQDRTGISLFNWKRSLMTALGERATRKNVIGYSKNFKYENKWFYTQIPVSDKPTYEEKRIIENNTEIRKKILADLKDKNFDLNQWKILTQNPLEKTEWSKERVKPKFDLNFSLKEFKEKYLHKIMFSEIDDEKIKWNFFKDQCFNNDKGNTMNIIDMNTQEERVRNIMDFNPFGGRDKNNDLGYPGDSTFASGTTNTLLIYSFTMYTHPKNKYEEDRKKIYENVPVFCFHSPNKVKKQIIHQPR